ncbi:hypothetical protein T4C_733, partial [Trichinella pseudospiralis]
MCGELVFFPRLQGERRFAFSVKKCHAKLDHCYSCFLFFGCGGDLPPPSSPAPLSPPAKPCPGVSPR